MQTERGGGRSRHLPRLSNVRCGMHFAEIEVTVDGAKAAVTLNRPDKLNPLSTTVLRELVQAARNLDTLADVKVVVIAGNGRAFSAGPALASFASPGGPPPRE